MTEKKMEKHIRCVSGGKDSMATAILALEHGEPLDLAVYCEVIFDADISGEVPEHRDFVYNTMIPWLEGNGVRGTYGTPMSTAVERLTTVETIRGEDGSFLYDVFRLKRETE